MSRFKDRLWSDLVRAHGADLSSLSRPAVSSGRRPRMLAGTGLGLVAAGSAAAIVVATAGTTPAFAVTKNHDGSVTVSIARPGGIPQANARLAALGYRARIVQVVAGCGGPAALARSIPAPPGVFRQIHAGARFDPRQVPPGRVLVMPAWRLRGTITIHRGRVVHGQVPACLPPPFARPGALRFLGRPPGPGMAGPCLIPGGPGFRLPSPRGIKLPGQPRIQLPPPRKIELPGRPRIQLPGGAQLQISGGPHLQISGGPQIQITAGQPNQHGPGARIHISVSCAPPLARLIPGPGQSRPIPNHH